MPESNMFVVGVDLGGTKIYSIVADKKGRIIASARKKTKANLGFEAVVDRIEPFRGAPLIHDLPVFPAVPGNRREQTGIGVRLHIHAGTDGAFRLAYLSARALIIMDDISVFSVFT